jgi:hypothetical protein
VVVVVVAVTIGVVVATGVLLVAILDDALPTTGVLPVELLAGALETGAGLFVTGALELTAGVVVATVPHEPSVFAKSPLVIRTQ